MKSLNLFLRILGCSLLLLFTHMSYAMVPETARFTGLKWVDLPDSSGHKGMFIAVTESATVYTSYDGVIWAPKILPGFPTQTTRITGVSIISDDEVTFITEERETEDSIYVRNISYTKDLRNLVNQGTPYIQRPTVKTNNHRIPGKELVIGNRVLRLYTHSIEVATTEKGGKVITETILSDPTNDFIDLDSAPVYDDKEALTGHIIVANGYPKRYIFQLDLANVVKNKQVITIGKAAESDIIVGGKELFKIHMNPSTLTLAAAGDNGRFTETPVVTPVSPGAHVDFAASLGNLTGDGSDIIVVNSHTTTDIITGNFAPNGRFIKHSVAPIDKRTCATVGKDAQGNYIFLILGEGNKSLYSRDGLNWIIKQM